jgi:hypothetical protein
VIGSGDRRVGKESFSFNRLRLAPRARTRSLRNPCRRPAPRRSVAAVVRLRSRCEQKESFLYIRYSDCGLPLARACRSFGKSPFLAANYCLCCLALITLRYREPEARRPYRAWAYPWSAWIVAAGAVIFLVGTLVGDTFNGLAAVGLCAVGLVGRAALAPKTISSSVNFRC